jgi:transposase
MKTVSYHVGIDLHKEVAQICVLDAKGENARYERRRLETPQAGREFVESLLGFKEGGRLVVEALGLNRWFVNACKGAGLDIVVADAAKLALKRSGKKTDKRDSYELARRLFLGDIDRSALTYYPTEEEYAGRRLVRSRHALGRLRLSMGNQIRSMLRAYNLGDPALLHTKKTLAWLRALTFGQPDLTSAFQAWVEGFAALTTQIAALSKALEAKAPKRGGVLLEQAQEPTEMTRRIRSLVAVLPSMAAQTATTLVCELGDVRRFRHSRAVAAYAGLAPRVANSADVAHHGSLTKHGSSELRWILSQWAVRLLADEDLAVVDRWAAPKRRRMHINKVRVALARRLLIGVYRMMRTGEAFTLKRCLAA